MCNLCTLRGNVIIYLRELSWGIEWVCGRDRDTQSKPYSTEASKPNPRPSCYFMSLSIPSFICIQSSKVGVRGIDQGTNNIQNEKLNSLTWRDEVTEVAIHVSNVPATVFFYCVACMDSNCTVISTLRRIVQNVLGTFPYLKSLAYWIVTLDCFNHFTHGHVPVALLPLYLWLQ